MKQKILFFAPILVLALFLVWLGAGMRQPKPKPTAAAPFFAPIPMPLRYKNTQTIDTGKLYFLTSCAKCHGNFGEGSPTAPNLTDATWLHGRGSFDDIYTIIRDGIPGTAMMGWSGKMQDEDIRVLAAFVTVISQKPLQKKQTP